ncbi:hypothetical protein GRT41_30045 [Burkholderia pseudomallei]|nr:hypothetical protein [Burkholderia pseudomallei]MXN58195.1 hypothetical protein [Burkholderia pseudomallei]PNX01859.1 hypothetical protein CF641_25530 [Burkholderia pseudomallei]PNX35962.1 hypothetical protein CF642_26220 [Burkholderia pseudomallei]QFS12826.1 hypothetical protein H10_31835 [Burkholderia pseudomallei]
MTHDSRPVPCNRLRRRSCASFAAVRCGCLGRFGCGRVSCGARA